MPSGMFPTRQQITKSWTGSCDRAIRSYRRRNGIDYYLDLMCRPILPTIIIARYRFLMENHIMAIKMVVHQVLKTNNDYKLS